jgi:YfiH family protein
MPAARLAEPSNPIAPTRNPEPGTRNFALFYRDDVVCVSTTKEPPEGDGGGRPFNMAAHVGPNRELAAGRRRRLCGELGLDFDGLTAAEQVHGARVAVVGEAERGAGRADRASAIRGVDGLATDRPDTPLIALSADCCPVALFDPVRRAVAVLHAGRKGTAGRIAAEGVRVMAEGFGSDPADLLAAVGPSIGPCCYEIGPEIVAEFPDSPHLFRVRGGSLYLDLWSANRGQLLSAGLRPGNIRLSGVCTACRTDLFFSYRREGKGCGLLATIIGLRG